MKLTPKQNQELYNYFFKYVQDLFFFDSQAEYPLSKDKQAKKDKERQIKNSVDGMKFHGFKSDGFGGYTLKLSSENNSFRIHVHGDELKNESSLFSIFGRFECKPNFEALRYQSVNEYTFKCNFHESFSPDSMSDAKRKIRAYISAILGGLK